MEVIIGSQFDHDTGEVIWALVHRGHMRLLLPPRLVSGRSPLDLICLEQVGELPAVGWEVLVEVAQHDPAVISAKDLPACERCKEPTSYVRRERWGKSLPATLSEAAATAAYAFVQDIRACEQGGTPIDEQASAS